MREVSLTNGGVALVDDGDYERVVAFHWYKVRRSPSLAYAARTTHPQVLLHRFILSAPAELDIDHRDHDGLNNQRNNIHLVTNAENCRNRRLYRRPQSTCATFLKGSGKWQAQKSTRNTPKRNIYLGLYPTKALATEAVRKYEREVLHLP